MRFQKNDGGRSAAGFQGHPGDCVCRAIAIADERPYQEVYDELNRAASEVRGERLKRGRGRLPGKYVARLGVPKSVIARYLTACGWTWTPTMRIGSGCTVHLKDGELPMGRLIVSVSRHMLAVIDGVIHDTYDEQRGGTRCVYGYWTKAGAP